MSSSGRAVVIRKNGGPEVLESVKDFSFPAAGDDEVLIKTVSSSVNPVDIYIRKGLFGPLAESPTVRDTSCSLCRRVQNVFAFFSDTSSE